MHTPRGIYEHYRIPPWLQLHQLRVAAVAKMTADSFQEPLDSETVLIGDLFHDMGNIIKFDFGEGSGLRSLVGAENVAHWEKVKEEFVAKYGTIEKDATRAIAQEIGVPQGAITIIENIGWDKMHEVAASDSYEMKIAEYGDMRVGPFGIVSVRERAEDGLKRYRAHMQEKGEDPEVYFAKLAVAAETLEQQIFVHSSITPNDITDETIAPIIEELWEYKIA